MSHEERRTARRARPLSLLLLAALLATSCSGSKTANSPAVGQHAGVVYEKAGISGRAELAAFFLQDLMLPEEKREALVG